MKIATFGTGNMARMIGGRWAEAGHEVFFGSRDPNKARKVAEEIGFGAKGGTNDQAAAFADVILHTVRVPPTEFLNATESLKGTIIVDLNNHDFPRETAWEGLHPSLAERVQSALPEAKVVKAFNTMAMEIFNHVPRELTRWNVSAFLAGDDAAALETVSDLARALGLHPTVVGGLCESWLLEAQADFIRTVIFGGAGAMATVNVQILPAPPAAPFGDRRPGSY